MLTSSFFLAASSLIPQNRTLSCVSLLLFRIFFPLYTPIFQKMAPSAIDAPVATITENIKSVVAKQPETQHVHGAEDKSPLEAISHGDIVLPGKATSCFLF